MASNQEFADIFEEFAEILQLKKELPFKIIAYQKAAHSITELTRPVAEIYQDHGIKGLEKIEGIGEGIAQKIAEKIETGKIKELDLLRKRIPDKQLLFLKIPGVGPATAQILFEKFGNISLEQLEKKLTKSGNKIFKQKTLEKIIKGIEIYKNLGDRMMLDEAEQLSAPIEKFLREKCHAEKVEVVGSLRRKKETVGDLDFVATSDSPSSTIDCFGKYKDFKDVLGKGETKLTAILRNGKEVDLEILPKKKYGSLLLHFTGSKNHNVHLRSLAQQKGLSLSEHGFLRLKDKRTIVCKDEEEVYRHLGMRYIEPELREDRGEIEAALKSSLPSLIERSELKGDLHVHSDWSDGHSTVTAIAEKAKKLGYSYVAIADHAANLKVHDKFSRELNDQKYTKRTKQIKEAASKTGVHIFNAIEASIKKDGSLELDDKQLGRFDFAIGSIHSNFDLSLEENTQRLIRAIENPYVKIIGHPTTRKINERPAIEVDWARVFNACVKKGVALEVNSSPNRLDLSDILVFEAIKVGVKFFINSDSHSAENLELIKYGISVARRGWCEKKDVLNSLSFAELKFWLEQGK